MLPRVATVFAVDLVRDFSWLRIGRGKVLAGRSRAHRKAYNIGRRVDFRRHGTLFNYGLDTPN